MEKKDPKSTTIPGLPEAINPEIGNRAAWEEDPYCLNLRLPDPSKLIDNLLFDDSDKAAIISKWKQPLTDPNALPDQSKEQQEADTREISHEKKKTKEKRITSPAPDRGQIPDWLESMEEVLVLKEDPNKPKDIIPEAETAPETAITKQIQPEGKRVKKAVKKARKELEKASAKTAPPLPGITESTLSPYTSWLKSLKGSEYVHPYEDDYALVRQKEGISETLADLLAAQGYKEQAVDMYTQLMAKYPEKSSFFAAKIEALK